MRTVDPKAHARQVDRILDAACSLFAKHGYSETSLDAVAAACSMKKPSLYHYFKGKEALLKSIVRRRMDEAHAQISARTRQGGSLRDQLYDTGMQFLQGVQRRRNRDFLMLMVNHAPRDPLMRRVLDQFKQEIADSDCAMPPSLLKEHSLPYPRAGAMFMHQFMDALFLYACESLVWKMGPCVDFKPEHYVGMLADIFSQAAQAPRPADRTANARTPRALEARS
jgi:AcrR family transcriptional regulator